MIQKGIATFGLDYGKCPRWLFEKMVRLGQEMIEIIVQEYGPDEFIKRIADPVWFQSLGTVLAFDWNASGLTTVLTASLKESIRNKEKDLGLFICGGKGKTSLKAPQQIENYSQQAGFNQSQAQALVYNSKMAAKVDSSLVQDNFQIYHHSFFFSKNGAWTVVQQGMNAENQTARRYHWYSEKVNDLVCEPHSGISSQVKVPTLDLTSKISGKNRKISAEMVQGNYPSLIKDIQILRKHSSKLSQMISLKYKSQQATLLNLENKEFKSHPVLFENFSKSRYLEKILYKVCEEKPANYENLLALKGVGPKTIRALSLVSEIIYGAKPSYQDPARYSFAHGGKDATPYPIDRPTYDTTIEFFNKIVKSMKTDYSEKKKMIARLNNIKS
ncbi:MAG: DUF763 domain-containing protein [Patescibacteria group bacterium]|nr:DUF763 domain-containing protein [Patescibacteria group bacterium]